MIIRELTYDEIPTLAKLMEKSAKLTMSDALNCDMPARTQMGIISLQQVYNNNPHKTVRFLCAEDNGEITGYMILYLNYKEEVSQTNQVYLYDFSVVDGYKGAKAACLLFEEATKITKDCGFQYIFGALGLNNPKMKKVYENRGADMLFYYVRKDVTKNGKI